MSQTHLLCPKCQSNYTQTFESVYLQYASVDTHSMTGLAALVAPPPQRSTVFAPGFFAVLTFYLAALSLPGMAVELGIRKAGESGVFDPLTVTTALILGTVLFAVLSARASTYNNGRQRELMKVWEQKVLCRRCAHTFELRTDQ